MLKNNVLPVVVSLGLVSCIAAFVCFSPQLEQQRDPGPESLEAFCLRSKDLNLPLYFFDNAEERTAFTLSEHIRREISYTFSSENFDINEILVFRRGSCDEFSRLYVACCPFLGIQGCITRSLQVVDEYSSLPGYTFFDRHTIAELRISGHPHLVDSTAGTLEAYLMFYGDVLILPLDWLKKPFFAGGDFNA